MILLKLPLPQIITHPSPNIKTARIPISCLQPKSPTLLLRLNGMIDVIRHRLINRPRIHSHTIQPRVYISAHHRTIQAIFIHNPFAMKQGITYTYCVIQQYLPKDRYRCGDKNRISLDNRLYLCFGTDFCRQRLVRTEPGYHTSDCQQYN